jgi:hypothetical protein
MERDSGGAIWSSRPSPAPSSSASGIAGAGRSNGHANFTIEHPEIDHEALAVDVNALDAEGEELGGSAGASMNVPGETSSRIMVPDTDPEDLHRIVLKTQPWALAEFEELPTAPDETKEPVHPFEQPERRADPIPDATAG